MILWRVARRDVRAKPLRYALTFVAVVIGTAFVGGTLTLTDTVVRLSDQVFAEVYGGPDAVVRAEMPTDTAWFGLRPLVSEELVTDVATLDGVEEAEGFVLDQAWLLDRDGATVGDARFDDLALGSVWVESAALNPFDLTDGSTAPRRTGEVAIDVRSARLAGYDIGDEARVQTTKGIFDVTITGTVQVGGADSPGVATVVLFSRDQAADTLVTAGSVSAVWVTAADGEVDQEAFAAQLHRQLPDFPATGRPVGAGATEIEVVTGDAVVAEFQQATRSELWFYARPIVTFAAVAIVVGALVISTSLAYVVTQRQRETALLRIAGATRRQVLRLVMVEALAVGIAASVVGYGVGVGLASVLQRIFAVREFGLPPAALAVRPGTAVFAIGLGVVVTLLAAVPPAWRATRVPPLGALRDVEIDRSVRLGPRLVVAVLFLLAAAAALASNYGRYTTDGSGAAPTLGLALAGLIALGPIVVGVGVAGLARPLVRLRGIAGVLARENAIRNPRRSALTAASLSVGLVVVTYTLMVDAAEDANLDRWQDMDPTAAEGSPVDFWVTSLRPMLPVPPSLADELRALPEVASANDPRTVDIRWRDDFFRIHALPQEELDAADLEIVEGDPAALGDAGVIVPRQQAEAVGWELGEELDADIGRSGTRTLTVVAIYDADTPDDAPQDAYAGAMLAGTALFDAYVTDPGSIDVAVELAEDVPADEGRAAVNDVLERYPLAHMYANSDDRGAIGTTSSSAAALERTTNALLALTLVVALTGIVNTQVLATIERQRELGLLRAVGATPGQVRAAVRWETVLVGILGALMAMAVGVPLSAAIVRRQLYWLPIAVPVVELVLVTALAAAVTFVASLLPAWWASRRIGPLSGIGRVE